MKSVLVKDVMLSVVDVPAVGEDATLAEAVQALESAQQRRPVDRLPFRVVLVVNSRDQVVGKVGHLAFLQALEPGYESPDERETFQRAGVDSELARSLSRYKRFWEEDLELACRRAAHLRVTDVMRGVGESVEEETSLLEAVSTLVRLGTLSVLVRRGDEVTGLLRLADVYHVAAKLILEEWDGNSGRAPQKEP
jgi:CBS domain-containing protein